MPSVLLVLALVGAAAALGGEDSDRILPAELDCSRAALTVEVEETGGDVFYCPDFFSNRTCCDRSVMTAVWEKLEDMLQFIGRVLDDQARGRDAPPAFVDGGCAEYHTRLFTSRRKHYERAREAAEKGAEILQGAGLQFLCAACFASTVPMKIPQIDGYIRRALLSVQDTMGAIWEDQLLADVPPAPECALSYAASLSEGVPFPASGRFEPQMAIGISPGLLPGTFAEWLDRVLSLLMELPSTLLFQESLLQLSFFYAERPETDAFWLLHAPPSLPGPAAAFAVRPLGSPPVLCQPVPHRLVVPVPQGLMDADLAAWRDLLAELAPAWTPLWVVAAAPHVRLLSVVPESAAGPDVLWRRFEVRDADALAASACGAAAGDGSTAWLVDLRTAPNASSDQEAARAAAAEMQRLATAPAVRDLRPDAWPRGFAPARALPAEGAWPADGLLERLRAHTAFAGVLRRGEETLGSKVLIYTCTSMTWCGGHGDRLNGMLGAAVVALLAGRHFFIDSQRPVPLALVLQPAEIDWQLSGTLAALPSSFNLNDNLAGFEADAERVLDSQADVLRFVSNQRLTPAALRARPQQADALGLRPRARLHSHLFKLLFRPSAALQRRLDARALPEGKLIGLHFRAGDQMPQHWKDPPRHALAEVDEFLDCAERVEASLGWEARFVLFADTDLVLELPRVQQLLDSGKLIWPAQTDSLVHLDRSPATLTVRGLLRVWADWWTLAFDTDALVLSHSGFGATALEIGPERPAFVGKGCVPAESSTG